MEQQAPRAAHGDSTCKGEARTMAVSEGGSGTWLLEDALVKRAAGAIFEADFLLVAGGAGLSADSGLPTFAGINKKLGSEQAGQMSYDQAAGSDMMCRDPGLFYGFWFACMHAYAEAEPHEGYRVLQGWRKDVENRHALRCRNRQAKTDAADEQSLEVGPEQPVFALTSNVDGFLRRAGVAAPGAVAEIHGSLRRWQCGGVPSGCRFPLLSRMRCGDELFESPPPEPVDLDAPRCDAPPPRCPRCKEGLARPNVYLFGDGDRFVADEETTGAAAYRQWCEAVIAALRRNDGLRLVIVEIGCGLRVPSIRKRCEELFAACAVGQAELVRINPEFAQQGIVAAPTVSLVAPALTALRQIQAEVDKLQAVPAP